MSFYEQFLCEVMFQSRFKSRCLVYIFSLRFSGSKFLINLRRQYRVRKIFRTQVFAGFAVFHFVFKITILETPNVACSLLKLAL